jgi:hypothetical protein
MATRDRDGLNRSLALQVLMDIDPEAGRPLLGHLRKLVSSKDGDHATDAARALLEFGDVESLQAIRKLADRWEPGLYRRTRLEVWMLTLEGRGGEILARLRAHDHVCVPWLAYAAARMIRTAEARSALAWGAENLPDEQCRWACREELAEGRW